REHVRVASGARFVERDEARLGQRALGRGRQFLHRSARRERLDARTRVLERAPAVAQDARGARRAEPRARTAFAARGGRKVVERGAREIVIAVAFGEAQLDFAAAAAQI